MFSPGCERASQVMTNCTVATTGLDIPECDMVALLDPRRRDVGQIAGRVVRRAPGKTKGVVFLAVFLERREKSLYERHAQAMYGKLLRNNARGGSKKKKAGSFRMAMISHMGYINVDGRYIFNVPQQL